MEVRNRGLSNAEQPGADRGSSSPASLNEQPPPPRRRRRRLWTTLLFLFLLYLTPLVLAYFSSWVRDATVFVHHIKTPYFSNISDPSSFDLKAAREFELKHEDGCTIPVWQMLPKHYHHSDDFLSEASYTTALSDGSPVLIYLHGNTGTRATRHRVDLYKYLSEDRGYHVITFDYRGFGNSECYPSERGMMEDSLLVWKWVKHIAPGARIYIWGHSLGTAAATYLAKELCDHDRLPYGLILDAPFPDLASAGENHPFSMPYWPVMRIFRYLILDSYEQTFESAKRMDSIRIPILILHGRGDYIVPFHLGEQVYQAALDSREKNPTFGRVDFVDCGDSTHKTNFRSSQAREAIKKFVS